MKIRLKSLNDAERSTNVRVCVPQCCCSNEGGWKKFSKHTQNKFNNKDCNYVYDILRQNNGSSKLELLTHTLNFGGGEDTLN